MTQIPYIKYHRMKYPESLFFVIAYGESLYMDLGLFMVSTILNKAFQFSFIGGGNRSQPGENHR
jgi:hypothetical protein